MKRTVQVFFLAYLFGLTCILSGCPSSAVQRQATAAEALSRVFNRALPVWVSVFFEDGERAVAAAETYAEGRTALRAVYARWQPVSDTWEAARQAHLAWREEIYRCRAETQDGGTCTANLRHLEANVVARITAFRCTLRAIGRGWVDELPGTPECSSLQDAGVRD